MLQKEPHRVVKIGSWLQENLKIKRRDFLKEYKDVFAWFVLHMPRIDRGVIEHRLNISSDVKPISRRRGTWVGK